MNLDSRIKSLERRLPPPPQSGGEIDYNRLSDEEREELSGFYERSGPGPEFDFSGFSDSELERLVSIIRKTKGGRSDYR